LLPKLRYLAREESDFDIVFTRGSTRSFQAVCLGAVVLYCLLDDDNLSSPQNLPRSVSCQQLGELDPVIWRGNVIKHSSATRLFLLGRGSRTIGIELINCLPFNCSHHNTGLITSILLLHPLRLSFSHHSTASTMPLGMNNPLPSSMKSQCSLSPHHPA